MIARHGDFARMLWGIFWMTLAMFALALYAGGSGPLAAVIGVFNGAVFYLACWFTLLAKSRSPWWILAPTCLLYLGALIVMALDDETPPAVWKGDLPPWAQ